jgi:hypothetical protein
MKVNESRAFRTPTTWARHSEGTALPKRTLKAVPNPVSGIPIRSVMPISAQI